MTRAQLESSFLEADLAGQFALASRFLGPESSLRDVHFMDQLIQQEVKTPDRALRVALMTSFTADSFIPGLRVELFKQGIFCEIYTPGFNQITQDVMHRQSDYHRFAPDVTILAEVFPKPSDPQAKLDAIKSLVTEITESNQSRVLLNTISPPMHLSKGLMDHSDPQGALAYGRVVNQGLVDFAEQQNNVYSFDLAALVSRQGEMNAYSQKMWYSSKIPFTSKFQQDLVGQWSALIKSFYTARKKCLVLDLDNTLWGGIIGEDGLSGIKLGDNYPGEVYSLIQSQIKAYADQGIILALNSKNNIDDAREVFDHKRGMNLAWDDFAAVRVNWEPKNKNLEALAAELNIGLDSMVFVDDNPAEISAVNQVLPMVETITFDGNPIENLNRISELDCFLDLDLTQEDRKKTEIYQSQQKRSELQEKSSSLEDYYRSLEMVATIEEGRLDDVVRLTQLTHKTNQFNLTTRRYDEAQMRHFLESEKWMVIQLRLEDRFGDNGLTGLLIAEIQAESMRIDTFLMSCRIIGRTAESALLAYLNQIALATNIKTLRGEYIETPKNAPVAEVYAKHGFQKQGEVWERSTALELKYPSWIHVRELTPLAQTEVR